MSRSEIVEHAGYVADAAKVSAYRAALRELITPESAVLDLGAGTGLLGLLAAEAGARVVYSIDRGSIVGVARAIARANGYADRVITLRGSSTEITLPEKVDLAVCDQMGGLGYDAGILDYFSDVRERLLQDQGVLVPRALDLMVAPVTTKSFWKQAVGSWGNRPEGFDMASMAEHAANTEFRVNLQPDALMGPPALFARTSTDVTDPISGDVSIIIDRPGMLHGITGLFRAQLSPSVTLSNCPVFNDRFDRWQNFYPLAEAVRVECGDVIDVAFDLRPRGRIASWRICLHSADGENHYSGSTAIGAFLSTEDLRLASGALVPQETPDVEIDRFVLDQVDGQASLNSVTDELLCRFPEHFASRQAAKDRTTALLWRHIQKDS
jgi:Arginine methyltransferase oligomerization subdomain/Ribosomal protein L11 methyltransferase (PrmA)